MTGVQARRRINGNGVATPVLPLSGAERHILALPATVEDAGGRSLTMAVRGVVAAEEGLGFELVTLQQPVPWALHFDEAGGDFPWKS